jgi:hypothetical protein
VVPRPGLRLDAGCGSHWVPASTRTHGAKTLIPSHARSTMRPVHRGVDRKCRRARGMSLRILDHGYHRSRATRRFHAFGPSVLIVHRVSP